jgi:hypothetical protein
MLTQRQREIIDGLMLGDGNLSIGKKAKNPRLRINRSYKDFEYAKWINHEFADYCSDNSLKISNVYDDRYKKNYKRIAFTSLRSKDFLESYERWYINGIKCIPKDLDLSPLTMAIWFADDGYIGQRFKNGITSGFEISFSTCSFSQKENEFLLNKINQIYGKGLRVYYKDNPKLKGSTRIASRIIKSFDKDFPPMNRKSNIWRCGPLDLNRYVLCKYCNTDSVYKNGFYYSRSGTKLAQKFKCNYCLKSWKD